LIYSYSRLKKYDECPAQFYRRYILELPEILSEASALGKAVHKAIELRLKGYTLDESVGMALSEAELPVNRDEVIAFVTHPEVENMCRNNLRQVEYHFDLPLEKDNPASPIIQGYIDLCWEDFLEVNLLDWKTSRKKYSPTANHQLGLYAWALSQITGSKHINSSLVFLRYGAVNCYEVADYGFDDMEGARNWALYLANKIEADLEKLYAEKYLSDLSNLSNLVYPSSHYLFPITPGGHCKQCSYAVQCQDAHPQTPAVINTYQDAETLGKEIIRLESALDVLKARLKEWVISNGPVQVGSEEFKLCPSISWYFTPDKLRELCQALGEDGVNPWNILSIGSTKLRKINWPEERLADYGKRKETTSFRKVKISDIA